MEMTYAEAVRDALDVCLQRDPNVILMGLGVPDRSGCFGTTKGLQNKYGKDRVFDTPCSEGAVTGACIGMAIAGLKPVLCHQRMDFTLLSMEQLTNQAAKWNWLFRQPVPMVVRMIVGRGWGQGPNHAQSFHSFFASVPGLKVICPTTPYDAKGMLIHAIEDPNPVIMVEHRWLHPLRGDVPEGYYTVPFKSRIAREGKDLTHVAISYSVVEAMRAATHSSTKMSHEVIDVRSLSPLDMDTILKSVAKTGRLCVSDIGYANCGISAEIVARVAEWGGDSVIYKGYRMTPEFCPSPSSPKLAEEWYWQVGDEEGREHLDVPDNSFNGPF